VVTILRIPVLVTPRAGRSAIDGWVGDELVVHVTAVPEDGKANAAVCRLVGKAIGMPKTSVCVVRGASSRHKLLEVSGGVEAEVWRRLGRPVI
jgi:uncharacterized protein YggU (UPF0235/DUF167 family)